MNLKTMLHEWIMCDLKYINLSVSSITKEERHSHHTNNIKQGYDMNKQQEMSICIQLQNLDIHLQLQHDNLMAYAEKELKKMRATLNESTLKLEALKAEYEHFKD